MLWELRRKALSLIPEWFVRLKVFMLKNELSKKGQERLLYSCGGLRGRFVDEIIRDYISCQLQGYEEVQRLYLALKKEKERLYKENQGLIYKVMRSMRVSPDDWEEVQDIAKFALYQAIEDWDEKHALSTLAVPLIMSRVQEYYEKNLKNSFLSYDEHVKEGEEDTFEIFCGAEDKGFNQAELKDLISRLEEKERELISLVYFEGYTIKEAGEKLGFSQKRASHIHKLALKKLKKLILGKEVGNS